jgi:hypothetical protein
MSRKAKPAKADEPFDDKQAEFIRIIADGGTWETACRGLGVSSFTLSKWLREDDDLAKQYARAREAQGDIYADRVVDTAMDPTIDPATARVRIDALKWAAGKRKPKVYGDSSQIALTGADGGPVETVTQIVRTIVKHGPNAPD